MITQIRDLHCLLCLVWFKINVNSFHLDTKYKILNVESSIGFNGWENIFIRFDTLTSWKWSKLSGTTWTLKFGQWDTQERQTSLQHQGRLTAPFSWDPTFGRFTMTLRNAQKRENAPTRLIWPLTHANQRSLPAIMPSASRWKSAAMAKKTAKMAAMNKIVENLF